MLPIKLSGQERKKRIYTVCLFDFYLQWREINLKPSYATSIKWQSFFLSHYMDEPKVQLQLPQWNVTTTWFIWDIHENPKYDKLKYNQQEK